MQGKNAIITGVSRKLGIGAALAREFAEAGVNVFISYYRPYDANMPWGNQPKEVKDLLIELKRKGIQVVGLELDLSIPEAAGQ